MIARVATIADIPELQTLIARSVRELSAGFYTTAQIEAALVAVFGVDTQLIADGTYYIIDAPAGLAAAGGWSFRRTLVRRRSDEERRRSTVESGHRSQRAFARSSCIPSGRAEGSRATLYAECSRAALEAGFRTFELMATLPGEPLYSALGFSAVERTSISLGDGVELPLVRMTRRTG